METLNHQSTEVLNFWFRELTPHQWFRGGAELDELITRRFAPLLGTAIRNECDDWAATPRGRLALIILLDQFSRHVFRDTAQSFALDIKAQHLCIEGIEGGMDAALTSTERHFFYMPLMHSEDMKLQALSIEKFTALRNEAEAILGFAKGHASMVERFGRFPHRNESLQRISTPQEEEFLRSSGNIFRKK
ncbi:MAG TPA: DUF924 family protein [Azonexus sp.]